MLETCRMYPDRKLSKFEVIPLKVLIILYARGTFIGWLKLCFLMFGQNKSN
ncbi:hypothetical protein ACE6H2_004438 [Prunus campanulata]